MSKPIQEIELSNTVKTMHNHDSVDRFKDVDVHVITDNEGEYEDNE